MTMVFDYPTGPFQAKHGPHGYVRYASYKDWLRDEFEFRCVYCLERETWYPSGSMAFGVDHIRPKGVRGFRRLQNVYDNLAYACNRCNARKGTLLLLDPRTNPFGTHLEVRPDGTIVGTSVEGKELILALGLDEPEAVRTRAHHIDVYLSFQDPHLRGVEFVERCYRRAFAYPESLPDLTRKAPPGNRKPAGTRACAFQRERGRKQRSIYF